MFFIVLQFMVKNVLRIINLKLYSVTYSTEMITANLYFVPQDYK